MLSITLTFRRVMLGNITFENDPHHSEEIAATVNTTDKLQFLVLIISINVSSIMTDTAVDHAVSRGLAFTTYPLSIYFRT